MPRDLRDNLPSAGTSVAVVSVAVLIKTVMMPDLDTQLMAMALILLGLIILQSVLGPMRRHSSRRDVQYGALVAYYLPFPLAIYAINTVRSSSDAKLRHLDLCGTMLLFSFQSVPLSHISRMSAYTLSDNPFSDLRVLRSFFYLLCLWGLFITHGVDKLVTTLLSCWILHSFAPISSKYLTKMANHTILVADYMHKAKLGSVFFEGTPSSLDGCKYPVELKEDGEWITISDLRQYGTPRDRDNFLSYSFFKLLTRRYLGVDCAEEDDPNVRDLVLRELLPDHKRAFDIVEVQLAFLQGYYFATYSNQPIHIKQIFLPGCSLFGMRLELVSIFTFILWAFLTSSLSTAARQLVPQNSFAAVALVIMEFLLPVAIWWFQNEQFLATDLYTVWDALRSHHRGIARNVPSRMNTWFRQPNWKNKIDQYSLIEDYDRLSVKKAFLTLAKAIIFPEWSPSFIKHHPVEEDAVRLTDSVRKLVALALRDINGRPTKGTSSLQRNRTLNDLSWTCKEKTHTHTILIWHIATCYCAMSPPVDSRLKMINNFYEIAKALSRYCGYLVAFLPEFLPEHKLVTQKVFQGVLDEAKTELPCNIWEKIVQEAKVLLGSPRMSKRSKIERLNFPEQGTLTTFQKGVKLGKQLEMLNALQRWKVMAEFWAETILHVAPSDNAAAHIERLANGGEFVTHIWALLSNAGILKRARPGVESATD